VKKGDYFKLVGSYEGVAWTGRRWERFECDACAKQQKIVARVPPLQGPMTPKASEALLGPVLHRHSIEIHRRWLETKNAK